MQKKKEQNSTASFLYCIYGANSKTYLASKVNTSN